MSNCKTSLTNLTSVERDPVFLSQKAKPGGVATLDANGKVPLSQIDIKAMFTERDPVYLADRGQPFGCATLDGSALVLKNQLGVGAANAGTFLRGDGVWAAPPSGGGGDIPEGWKLTGTDVSLATSTSKVVVGALPTLAKFGVVGSNPADVTTLIRAAAAQTADIFEIQNSAGLVLLSIGATVYVEMNDGSTAPVSTVGHGRQRYNNIIKRYQVSVDGGPWETVISDEREVERIAAMLDL